MQKCPLSFLLIKYHILTESEVITGKSVVTEQTRLISYLLWPFL